MPEQKLIGVIYARYSSSNQREESIEGQIRECTEYAERSGIQIVDIYADHALTGTNDQRPEFQRMIRDSEKRVFNVVLCYKMDRFSRDRYDSAIYKTRLKRNGVNILYAKEHIPEGPEGIIFESLLEGFAEYYSANLAQNIKRGYRENALKGLAFGPCPLGLTKDSEGFYTLDPATNHIIKLIFDELDAGTTVENLCTLLKAKGYKTARGNDFKPHAIYQIARNPKYCGLYIYEDIIHTDKIPPTVTREKFDSVQRRIGSSPSASSKHREDDTYLLSGKIFCGSCGAPMIGMSGTSKTGDKHYYYACQTVRRKKGGCGQKNLKRDVINDLVITHTVQTVLQNDVIDYIADRVMDIQASDQSTSALKYLEKQLAAVEKSIKNIMSAIEEGIFTPSTKNRLNELENQKAEIELSIAKESIAKPTVPREFVVYWLNRFKDMNLSDPAVRRSMVDTFVNAVYVCKGSVVIIYNYSDAPTDPLTPKKFKEIFPFESSSLIPSSPSKNRSARNGAFAVLSRLCSLFERRPINKDQQRFMQNDHCQKPGHAKKASLSF